MTGKHLSRMLAMLAGLAAPLAAQADLGSVLACMQASVPDRLRIQQIEMTAVDRQGAERVLRGRLYAQREAVDDGLALVRATLRIDAPDYLAGAAYLVRQNEIENDEGMYVYLPSVKRVRRISGEFADGALLGTHFSYYDFKQMQSAFSDATPAYDGEGELDGQPVWRMRFTPQPSASARYTRIDAWIDRETCLTRQLEFRERERVRKRLSTQPDAMQNSDGHWYVGAMTMTDLVDGGHTVLRVLDVRTEQATPARYFDPERFHLGP
jgi:hypothetical protein